MITRQNDRTEPRTEELGLRPRSPSRLLPSFCPKSFCRILPLLLLAFAACGPVQKSTPRPQDVLSLGVTLSSRQCVNGDLRLLGVVPIHFGSPDGIRFYGFRDGVCRCGVPLSDCPPEAATFAKRIHLLYVGLVVDLRLDVLGIGL